MNRRWAGLCPSGRRWGEAFLVAALLAASFAAMPAAASDDGAAPLVVPYDVQVALPQISWEVYEGDAAEAINAALRAKATSLVQELAAFGNVTGEYTVQLQEAGIISVSFLYSAYYFPQAHPTHLMGAVTADLESGAVYSLADLFADDRYIEVVSRAVARGIAEQDIPTLIEFEGIAPDQEFFLTPEGLVVYFQLYELAPYAWGFPQFTVAYEELLPIAKEDGPIARLAGRR